MLFVFAEAANGFWIALLIFGFEGGQVEQGLLLVLLRCQTPANAVLTSCCSRLGMALSTLRCLCTKHRCRKVAGKRSARAASSPSCPSVTKRLNLAHSTGAQILQQTIPAILTLLRTRTEGEHFSASFQIDSQSR